MAEGGIAVDQDDTETMSSFHDAPPTVADILIMTVEELRTELRVRGVARTGGAKPELQALLLREIGLVRDPPPDQQDGHPESDPEAEEPLVEEPPQLATVGTVPADPSVRPHPDYTLPPPGGLRAPPRESTESTDAIRTLELQLQLRRLEIEEADRQRRFQVERAKDQERTPVGVSGAGKGPGV